LQGKNKKDFEETLQVHVTSMTFVWAFCCRFDFRRSC